MSSMACRYDDSFKPAEDDGTPWLEGLFEGAQDALQHAEDRVSAYMAAKVPTQPTPLEARLCTCLQCVTHL